MRDTGFMRDETLYAKIVDGIGFRYLQVAALTGWHCKGIALNNRPMTPTLPFHQACVDKQGGRLLRSLRNLVDETRQSRPKLRTLAHLEEVVQVCTACIWGVGLMEHDETAMRAGV